MFSLLLVLFFAITGITLNHPEWAFGEQSTRTLKGKLPGAVLASDEVNWLQVVEHCELNTVFEEEH